MPETGLPLTNNSQRTRFREYWGVTPRCTKHVPLTPLPVHLGERGQCARRVIPQAQLARCSKRLAGGADHDVAQQQEPKGQLLSTSRVAPEHGVCGKMRRAAQTCGKQEEESLDSVITALL